MTLPAGTHLGSYEILGTLGAGGMGEVYRARDTQLGREVAVKVVPSELAEDRVSIERFEREARAVASLSHPNVLQLYDYGREDEILYAVLELLEGETLRQRLKREGSLPQSKAVAIAERLARGLSAAHEKGVVHRDLKPENVFLTTDGRVKILDFGMAKVRVFEGIEPDAPTAAVSTPGAMFGTIEYMSPEQVRGQEADSRADLFALGIVLYEMLSGSRPFQGDSVADVMTAILSKDPQPLDAGDRAATPALRQVVGRCLEKQPEERFRSAHDLALALEMISSTLASGPASGVSAPADLEPPRPSRRRAGIALGIGAALAVALVLGWWLGRRGAGSHVASSATFSRLTDLPGVERFPSLSPDGTSFLFVSDLAGNADVYLQRVGGQKTLNLTADSESDDTAPAFSPDGQLIAFRSGRDGGGVFLMGATGESVRRLTDFGFDPAWSPDGTRIVVATEGIADPLARFVTSELWIVDVESGDAEKLSEGDAVQPAWSPGGERIAFWATPATTGLRDVLTIGVDGGDPVPVTDDPAVDWSPTWSPDGRSLYFSSDRGGTMNLWRIAIDPNTGEPRGAPRALTTPAEWSGSPSLSADGKLLAYSTYTARSTVYRVQLDLDAREVLAGSQEPVLRGSVRVRDLDVSPDGSEIVFTSGGRQEDLFVLAADGEYRKLTDDEHRDRGPRWSPAGDRIAFYSNRSGRYEVWIIHADGSGLERLSDGERSPWFPVWAPDGATIAVADGQGTWLLDSETGRSEILPPLGSDRHFGATSWSPDGRRLAGLVYRDDGSLEPGLVLYDLPDRSYRQLLDTGTEPFWVADDRLVFFRNGGIALLDVESGTWSDVLPGVLGTGDDRGNFAVSANGTSLVFADTATAGDVWLLALDEPRPD